MEPDTSLIKVTTRLPKPLLKAVKAAAVGRERSVQSIVHEALHLWLLNQNRNDTGNHR